MSIENQLPQTVDGGKLPGIMTFRSAFGAIIVVLLLVLYVLLVRSAISLLDCTPQPACLAQFTDSMALALSSISGLVSAVVIAELALTVPGNPPFRRLLPDRAGRTALTVLRILTVLYLGTWLAVGIWVLVATWQRAEMVPSLTALGRSWLGLAVAAGYAYFGIKPGS